MTDQQQRGVGIDVSKATLDVARYPDGEQWQLTDDEAGISSLVERLTARAPDRIVLEATGGYQAHALAALGSTGLTVVAVNPRQPAVARAGESAAQHPWGRPRFELTLLADVPELGTLRHEQLAALIGVAPLNRDSGRWRGKRSVWADGAHVRAVLFMAARSAVRSNPVIRRLYQRLRQAGKADRVAMTACMSKLLRICNAVISQSTPWRYQPLDS